LNIDLSLKLIHQRIESAALAARRLPAEVKLLAVSKLKPASAIRAAYACGQRAFGENYVQEALAKMRELDDLDLRFHLIGPLQSNKAREAANAFAQIESVDRPKLIDALAQHREPARGPLDVLIQVNIDQQPSKSGCAPGDALALAARIAQCPTLRLRGLMSIPDPDADPAAAHRRLFALLGELRAAGYPLAEMSAGMSDDLEAAIAAGSTQVRIGSALFGAR